MKIDSNQITERLQNFCGTETFYTIALLKTRFTDGIKYLAETANCFWLVTDASIMAKSLQSKSYFITIDFKRFSEDEQQLNSKEAELIYSDGNDNVLFRRAYYSTDFPLDELRLFFVDDTLMLPGEY